MIMKINNDNRDAIVSALITYASAPQSLINKIKKANGTIVLTDTEAGFVRVALKRLKAACSRSRAKVGTEAKRKARRDPVRPVVAANMVSKSDDEDEMSL